MQPVTAPIFIEEGDLLEVDVVLANQERARASLLRRLIAGGGTVGLALVGGALLIAAPSLDELKAGENYQAYLTETTVLVANERYAEFESEVASRDLRLGLGYTAVVLGLASGAWWGFETLREVKSSLRILPSLSPFRGAAGGLEMGVMAQFKGEFDGFGGQD